MLFDCQGIRWASQSFLNLLNFLQRLFQCQGDSFPHDRSRVLESRFTFVSSGGAGAGAVGKAVDADVGYEDGAVEWCEEPEGDVCPDAE